MNKIGQSNGLIKKKTDEKNQPNDKKGAVEKQPNIGKLSKEKVKPNGGSKEKVVEKKDIGKEKKDVGKDVGKEKEKAPLRSPPPPENAPNAPKQMKNSKEGIEKPPENSKEQGVSKEGTKEGTQEISKDGVPPGKNCSWLVQVPDSGAKRHAILEESNFYHGFMKTDIANECLQNKPNGSFLIRRMTAMSMIYTIISVSHEGTIRHYEIRQTMKKRLFYVDGFAFRTIPQLVDFYMKRKLPLLAFMVKPAVYLKHIVKKERTILNHEQLDFVKKLGEGQFGEVYEGYLEGASFLKQRRRVAIKKVVEGLSLEEKMGILIEADVMRGLNHPNVVKFFGMATSRDPILVVMEYCDGGSLESIIKKRSLPIATKLKYLLGAANGLGYLHENQILHRDIAARNCLVDKYDRVKISDFGLSISKVGLDGYKNEGKKGMLPARYMAPESLLHQIYTRQTDVYSFGAMIYEMFHRGARPYDCYEVKGNNISKLIILRHIRLYLWERPDGVEPIILKPKKVPKAVVEEMAKRQKKKFNVSNVVKYLPHFDDQMDKPMNNGLAIDLENIFNICRSYDPKKRPLFWSADGLSVCLVRELLKLMKKYGYTERRRQVPSEAKGKFEEAARDLWALVKVW